MILKEFEFFWVLFRSDSKMKHKVNRWIEAALAVVRALLLYRCGEDKAFDLPANVHSIQRLCIEMDNMTAPQK